MARTEYILVITFVRLHLQQKIICYGIFDGRDEVDNGVVEVLPLNQMATQTKWFSLSTNCSQNMFPSHVTWSWKLGRELLCEDCVTFFSFVHDKWELQVSQLWVMLSLSVIVVFSLEWLYNLSCFILDGYADTSVCSWEGSSITDFSVINSGRDTCSEKCLLTHRSRNCKEPQKFFSVLSEHGRSLHIQWDVTIARPGNSLWEDQNAYQLSAVLRCPDSGQCLHASFLLHLRRLLLNSRPVASRTELISILLVPVHDSGYWEQTRENLWFVCVGLEDS